jgi:hypothetical protein
LKGVDRQRLGLAGRLGIGRFRFLDWEVQKGGICAEDFGGVSTFEELTEFAGLKLVRHFDRKLADSRYADRQLVAGLAVIHK